MADDKDLNKVVGLKRLQPYRRGKARPSDLNTRLKEFRGKFSNTHNASTDDGEKKKRPGKRERERKAAAKKAAEEHGEKGIQDEDVEKPESKKRKKASKSIEED